MDKIAPSTEAVVTPIDRMDEYDLGVDCAILQQYTTAEEQECSVDLFPLTIVYTIIKWLTLSKLPPR